MFKFICNSRNSPNFRAYLSVNRLLSFSQSSSSSSSSKTLDSPCNSSNQKSFAFNYLINSFGFDPKSALSASKYLTWKTPDKPDSVLAFFKNYGFSNAQIAYIVRSFPRILSCDPRKIILPKFEFFSSIGYTSPQIARVVCAAPKILRHSLEKTIIPSSNFFRELLQSDERASIIYRSSPNLRSYLSLDRLLSCGLHQESDLSTASKHLEDLRCEIAHKSNPDAVLAIFKNYGFTDTQIEDIVNGCPKILTSHAQKTILPKFEFLSSIGYTNPDIVKVVTAAPRILRYGMRNKIIPSYDFFRDLLLSNEKTVVMHRSSPHLRSYLPVNRLLYCFRPSETLDSYLPKRKSFVVHYLINSCGFGRKSANSANKYLTFKTRDQPDSVLAFFKNHGFTNTQISDMVKKYPRILSCDPQISLLPELEFFSSIGFMSPEIVRVVTKAPDFLRLSLEKKIIPSYNFLRDLLQSDVKTVDLIKRFPYFLTCLGNEVVVQNIQILQDAGVPKPKIIYSLTYFPRNLKMATDTFRNRVEDVKEMGFDPSTHTFMWAFNVLQSMGELTLEKKMEFYRRWGWSGEDVLTAFRKHPLCLVVSQDKIKRVMDFLVKKMHIRPSLLVNKPKVFLFSLEKRIIPRCLFYQVLLDKGLIKKIRNNRSLIGWVDKSENNFIKRIRLNFKDEAPQLLELYRAKLSSAK